MSGRDASYMENSVADAFVHVGLWCPFSLLRSACRRKCMCRSEKAKAAAAASVASGQSPASQAANFSSTSTPSTDLASLTCHATGRRRAALSAYRARSAIQLLSTVKPSWTTWMRPDATPLSSTATATARFACSSAPAPALLIGQQGLQVCDAGVPRECGHRRPHSL